MNIHQKEKFFSNHAITLFYLFTYSVCNEKVKILNKSQISPIFEQKKNPTLILKLSKSLSNWKSFFVQPKVVRNNNCVFLLRIDMNFSLFLVEFCQYLEYSTRVLSFLLGMYSWLFLSFIFNCKKSMEQIFMKFRNNFV